MTSIRFVPNVPSIQFVPDNPGVIAPVRGSAGAAAWDLRAAEDVDLKPYQATKIRSGLKAAIPPEHALLILSRSGFAFKSQIILPNGVGLIDEDYRGEIGLGAMWMPDPLVALEVRESVRGGYELRRRKDAVFSIRKGDRIVQALLIKYVEQDWREAAELEATSRGDNGFGSTGLRSEDAGCPAVDPAGAGRPE